MQGQEKEEDAQLKKDIRRTKEGQKSQEEGVTVHKEDPTQEEIYKVVLICL